MSVAAFEVIHSDNHLLVLNKPAGLLTQDSGSGRPNLEEMARELVRREKGRNGAVFLHCVHRIDRLVSGLVLFARTSKALARLQSAPAQQAMTKTYCAAVEGRMPDAAGTLTDWLEHGDHHARVVPASSGRGKKSVLHYRVLADSGSGQCLEITLETGRYHQIRAQLAAAGCPIVGDRRYGSHHRTGEGISLHHLRLRLRHPVGNLPLTFVAATVLGHAPHPDQAAFTDCVSLLASAAP
ncbi:MAG: RNA pseudouridine synthase [Thermodesulfobacteriota bacterium]